jgi:hypothetical protein
MKWKVHYDFGEICMNTTINICSGPKMLDNPPNPVLMAALMAGTPSEHLPHCTVETIRERAETMTPLLKEILEHWPTEHWGLNE